MGIRAMKSILSCLSAIMIVSTATAANYNFVPIVDNTGPISSFPWIPEKNKGDKKNKGDRRIYWINRDVWVG